MPDIKAAAAIAGRTPAINGKGINYHHYITTWREFAPVDLYKAPVMPPAPILPIISCFPRAASIEELTALYTRAMIKSASGQKYIGDMSADGPRTPAEFPMNVPLLVTELSTLLIRNRVLVTARGLRAPSLIPHTPPRAKPRMKISTCDENKTIRFEFFSK